MFETAATTTGRGPPGSAKRRSLRQNAVHEDFMLLPAHWSAPLAGHESKPARRVSPGKAPILTMSPALAAPSHIRTVTTVDAGWYRAVTSFAQQTAWLHEPMHLYSGGGIVLLGLLAVAAWWTARARADPSSIAAVAWLGVGSIVSVGAGLLLKNVFQESRPCQAIHVATVEACPGGTDYSFPSDHTTFAVALAVGLWLVNRKLGIIALALAALEGFDRVYTGQHYPHDVIAAALLGAVVMLLGWPLARGALTRLVEALEQTRLRPLLTVAGQPDDARSRATVE